MDSAKAQRYRSDQARERQTRLRRARVAAVGSLVTVAVIAAGIVLTWTTGSSSPVSNHVRRHASTAIKGTSGSQSAATQAATVPILAYDVINVPPPQSTMPPSLYVPVDEFSAQMSALKADGWHAVTLDQLQAYWTRGVSLGSSKPIVITFDSGYASQYTNALPVLKSLGWVAVENLQVNGLAPSDGGLSDAQVRGLIASGWELDTEGLSGTDLTALDSTEVSYEVATARQTLRTRYGTPVNWFSYPTGSYDATVIAAVHAAGFVGATTLVAGWASPQADRFRLPRLQVLSGTSPSNLLSQITSAEATTSTPAAYQGT